MGQTKLENIKRTININKRRFRADGLSLLPSALRPRLLSRIVVNMDIPAFVLAILAIALLQTPHAESVSAASLTLSVPAEPLTLDISPSNNEEFSKSSPQKITVSSDALAGYTLTIKSKDDNKLRNGDFAINSIPDSITEYIFKTNPAYNRMWGYAPSKLNSKINENFIPGPITSETILEKTNSKNDIINQYDFILGVKVDNTIPSGIYSNSFVFTITSNPIPYSITYNANAGDDDDKVTTMPTNVNSTSTSETVTLDPKTPIREGYEFKGWCDHETSNETCSGTTYQPGDTYTLTGSTNDLVLWGMWKSAGIIDANCPGVQITECEAGGIKGERYNGGPCWMTSDQEPVQYDQMSCPDGWSEPSETDFNNLISASHAGSGACLYSRGWNYSYWSSTTSSDRCGASVTGWPWHYYYQRGLSVNDSSAKIGDITSWYSEYRNSMTTCTGRPLSTNYYHYPFRCYAP